jgi:signal transduction histidine kinase
MGSSRKRLRLLTFTLLGCLTLLSAFSALVAVRHLATVAGNAVLVLADSVVLLAAIGSVGLTVAVSREVATVRARRVELTREAAANLGDLLARVSRGEPVDHTGGAGRLAADEDDTLRAFAHAYAASAGAALTQAAVLRDVRRMAVGLARRNQALVTDQLRLLDARERDCVDADELADLFALDHLATRIRRQTETLLILCGDPPDREVPATVPVVDVVRAATCEVADYPRVRLLPIESAWLHGDAVPDVTHLLAELMGNALRFSPSTTAVRVSGASGDGYTIEIEDSGFGMVDAARQATNEEFGAGSAGAVSAGGRLGVAVAARLAQRQGIDVRLRESPHGGTIATVRLPAALLAPADPRAISGLSDGSRSGGSRSGDSLSGDEMSGDSMSGAAHSTARARVPAMPLRAGGSLVRLHR